ncbi:hypothetical protein HK100_009204 [Physocladia obscura]|uniref:DUF1640 domain-containing protein n=1 Tax=Physocladia obscura TaxID=109957 RepID=A0AAD5T5A1_9FUNG|nr:hypothetical protein HK100_009204 [Physocladia obscura]
MSLQKCVVFGLKEHRHYSSANPPLFDTYEFVAACERDAKLDPQVAEALLSVLSDAVSQSVGTVATESVTSAEFEKRVHANSIDFSHLRADLGLVEKNDFMLLKADVARLSNDVEKLHMRSAEEFRRIQANTRLEISMEKSRIKDDQNAQTIRMKEMDAQIESDLASIKTVMEGLRWDLFRSLFPLLSAAGALAFSYLRFLR